MTRRASRPPSRPAAPPRGPRTCGVSRRRRGGGGRAAFTLIEIMISLAIVLAMIIGVNQVFKVTADTVGAGNALSAKVRDGRAAQAVFSDELNHVARNSPFLIIASGTQRAFETPADQQNDIDYSLAADDAGRLQRMLTVDFDGNNVEGETGIVGELIPATAINNRNHRVDILSFFATDLYRRQTGNPGVYAADQSSNEAWITYAHARVYDQVGNIDLAASYPLPGELPVPDLPGPGNPNPKNFYASDWVLGRMQMLLVAPVDDDGDGYGDVIYQNPIGSLNPQFFWAHKPSSESAKPNPTDDIADLEPLGPKSQVNNAKLEQADGRYDLAGTTFRDFTTTLQAYIQHTPQFNAALGPKLTPEFDPDWWYVLTNERFRCNPYPRSPLDSRKVAQAAPVLLPNCTQFVVEFAGDFLTQQYDMNGDGAINATDWGHKEFGKVPNTTGAQPDGIIDFYVENVRGTRVQKIRWYGLPRDVDGDGVVLGNAGGVDDANLLVDVVPVRDVLHTNATFRVAPYDTGLPFERTVDYDKNGTARAVLMPARTAYSVPNLTNATGAGAGMSSDDRYVVAWGPNDDPATRPKMIRLIVTLTDPSGRLATPQTYEYVANLP